MGRYSLRKEKGAKRPFSKKKKDGYALFYDGKPVYPKFRNWWPNKKDADVSLKRVRENPPRKRRGRRLMLTFDDLIF